MPCAGFALPGLSSSAPSEWVALRSDLEFANRGAGQADAFGSLREAEFHRDAHRVIECHAGRFGTHPADLDSATVRDVAEGLRGVGCASDRVLELLLLRVECASVEGADSVLVVRAEDDPTLEVGSLYWQFKNVGALVEVAVITEAAGELARKIPFLQVVRDEKKRMRCRPLLRPKEP